MALTGAPSWPFTRGIKACLTGSFRNAPFSGGAQAVQTFARIGAEGFRGSDGTDRHKMNAAYLTKTPALTPTTY